MRQHEKDGYAQGYADALEAVKKTGYVFSRYDNGCLKISYYSQNGFEGFITANLDESIREYEAYVPNDPWAMEKAKALGTQGHGTYHKDGRTYELFDFSQSQKAP